MNKFLAASLLPAVAFVSACGSTQIARFDRNGAARETYPPVPAEDVVIYRKTKPDFPYVELGMITTALPIINLDKMYAELRKKSGKIGGEYIIDVKTKSSVVAVYGTSSSCTPKGGCVSHTTVNWVTTFSTTGTVVRRSR